MGFDLTGKSGNYFRANCWSWHPILALVEQVNNEDQLGLNLENWGYNDGGGLDNQEDCDRLASAIEKRTGLQHKHVLEIAGSSCRVDASGRFLHDDEPGGQSPYSTDGEHMLEFVKFLCECGGGFEIW